MISRGFRYRLYPTAEQEKRLIEVTGAVRFVYNLAIEQRRDWWRQFKANTGRRISWASQSVELTGLRKEAGWLRSVPRSILEQALRDADRAFQNFFGKSGLPGFRCKDRFERFRIQGREAKLRRLNGKWSTVKLGTLDWIKFRDTRDIAGTVKNGV